MNNQQYPLTKQDLFVNPISIVEKQKAKTFPANQKQKNIQANQLNDVNVTQNFNELLLHAVDPQTEQNRKHNPKSKHIFKKQPSLSAAQIKQKHYRTRMCPQGIECKKRLICQFAHTQFELRRPYKNRKNPCMRYQKGLCSLGSACPDYHGNMDLKKKNYKYKIQKCQEWLKKGTCSKGKLCIYIHDEDEISLEQSESLSEGQNVIEIKGNHEQVLEGKTPQNEQEPENLTKNQVQRSEVNNFSVKILPKNIFNTKSENKKAILVTEVVQEIIQKNEQKLGEENQNQEENFNISFNF